MILRTKLEQPSPDPKFIFRPRLSDRLSAAVPSAAIMLSAPAGYGKSVLVSHWLESRAEPCARLSLDASENEWEVLATHLFEAISSVLPGSCPKTEVLLRDSGSCSMSDFGHCLINELAAIETRFILVLEGLERVTNKDSNALIGLILEQSLASLCVVICTRRDPPLYLSRMRARGRLTELRLDDLAFNVSETEALLMKGVKGSVSEKAVANLQSKLEGWPAGLRLVMSVLPDQLDSNQFLLDLETGPRSTEQYLDEEVLSQLCPCFRDRLYKASILDRCNSALWRALFGAGTCEHEEALHPRPGETWDPIQAQLDKGVFLISMDAEGSWYRYHPALLGLLRERLRLEFDAEVIAALQDSACHWFEAEHLISDAIDVALSAGDEIRAAEIVERNRADALESGRAGELESWLAQLPGSLRAERAGLLMAEVSIAYQNLELGTMWRTLELVDASDESPTLSTERIMYRGVQAFFEGDIRGSTVFFDQVLERAPNVDSWLLLDSRVYRGLTLYFHGQGDEAFRQVRDAFRHKSPERGSPRSNLIGAALYFWLLQGHLIRDGWEITHLSKSSHPRDRSWSDYVRGISAFRRFDLPRAQEHLSRVQHKFGWLKFDAHATLALVFEMQGLSTEADACLARAWEEAQVPKPRGRSERIQPLISAEARLALLRGDLESARRWQESGRYEFSAAHSPIAVEVPAITACRVLAEAPDSVGLESAADQVETLWDCFKTLHYSCQQHEIAPLRALILHRLGRQDEALSALRESLDQAAHEGWIRPYVELGAPMEELIRQLPSEGTSSDFVRQILSILNERRDDTDPGPISAHIDSSRENLTKREREVLELLRWRLRDKEIAKRLNISPDTVKSHLKSLYRKLRSRSRTEAVEKAISLNLLPRQSGEFTQI